MTPDAMLVVLAMRSLAWTSDVDALAAAIMAEAQTWDEATLAVAVIFREASNRLNVIGDHGRARCAMQLHNAPREVLTDARLCVRIGLARLRDSMRLCPATPLASYAGAPCGSVVAGRISRDRDAVRKRVLP